MRVPNAAPSLFLIRNLFKYFCNRHVDILGADVFGFSITRHIKVLTDGTIEVIANCCGKTETPKIYKHNQKYKIHSRIMLLIGCDYQPIDPNQHWLKLVVDYSDYNFLNAEIFISEKVDAALRIMREQIQAAAPSILFFACASSFVPIDLRFPPENQIIVAFSDKSTADQVASILSYHNISWSRPKTDYAPYCNPYLQIDSQTFKQQMEALEQEVSQSHQCPR